MDIQIDLSALQVLASTPQRLEQATERALDRVAGVALQAKAREVNATYRRSIPRGKSGKPKWKRSGDWQGGQCIESQPGERAIITANDAAKYENRIANLPRGRDGVDRRNPAAENAARKIEPQIAAIVENEIANALR